MPRSSKVGKKPTSKPRPADTKGRTRRGRPKVCLFCTEHIAWVDYKDLNVLRRFVNDRGRIKSRGATGTCAQHQRDVAVAVKTARELALLPYAVRTVSSEPGDRRGGPRRGRPPMSAAGGSDQAGADGETGEAGTAEIGSESGADDADSDTVDTGAEGPEASAEPEGQTEEPSGLASQ